MARGKTERRGTNLARGPRRKLLVFHLRVEAEVDADLPEDGLRVEAGPLLLVRGEGSLQSFPQGVRWVSCGPAPARGEEVVEACARAVEALPAGTWGDASGERSPWPEAARAVRAVGGQAPEEVTARALRPFVVDMRHDEGSDPSYAVRWTWEEAILVAATFWEMYGGSYDPGAHPRQPFRAGVGYAQDDLTVHFGRGSHLSLRTGQGPCVQVERADAPLGPPPPKAPGERARRAGAGKKVRR